MAVRQSGGSFLTRSASSRGYTSSVGPVLGSAAARSTGGTILGRTSGTVYTPSGTRRVGTSYSGGGGGGYSAPRPPPKKKVEKLTAQELAQQSATIASQTKEYFTPERIQAVSKQRVIGQPSTDEKISVLVQSRERKEAQEAIAATKAAEKYQADASKAVEDFNEKYGGKSLTQSEYNKAMAEQKKVEAKLKIAEGQSNIAQREIREAEAASQRTTGVVERLQKSQQIKKLYGGDPLKLKKQDLTTKLTSKKGLADLPRVREETGLSLISKGAIGSGLTELREEAYQQGNVLGEAALSVITPAAQAGQAAGAVLFNIKGFEYLGPTGVGRVAGAEQTKQFVGQIPGALATAAMNPFQTTVGIAKDVIQRPTRFGGELIGDILLFQGLSNVGKSTAKASLKFAKVTKTKISSGIRALKPSPTPFKGRATLEQVRALGTKSTAFKELQGDAFYQSLYKGRQFQKLKQAERTRLLLPDEEIYKLYFRDVLPKVKPGVNQLKPSLSRGLEAQKAFERVFGKTTKPVRKVKKALELSPIEEQYGLYFREVLPKVTRKTNVLRPNIQSSLQAQKAAEKFFGKVKKPVGKIKKTLELTPEEEMYQLYFREVLPKVKRKAVTQKPLFGEPAQKAFERLYGKTKKSEKILRLTPEEETYQLFFREVLPKVKKQPTIPRQSFSKGVQAQKAAERFLIEKPAKGVVKDLSTYAKREALKLKTVTRTKTVTKAVPKVSTKPVIPKDIAIEKILNKVYGKTKVKVKPVISTKAVTKTLVKQKAITKQATKTLTLTLPKTATRQYAKSILAGVALAAFRPKVLTKSKTREFVLERTRFRDLAIPKFKFKQKSIVRPKEISLAKPKAVVKPKSIPKTQPIEVALPKLKELTLTKPKLKSRTRLGTRTLTKPKVKKKKRDIIEVKSEDKPRGTYHAYTRRKKNTKWVKVTKKPLPYNAAFNKGLQVADNTVAATVKLEPSSKKGKMIDDPFINDYKFRRRKTGSKIPGKEVIFTEKNQFRIDTLGEKQGLKASKYKGGNVWAF